MMADEPSTRPEDEAGPEETGDEPEAAEETGDAAEAAEGTGDAAEARAEETGDAAEAKAEETGDGAEAKAGEGSGEDDGEEEEAPEPEPDPETCRAVAICLDHFDDALYEGEFDGSDYLFYLEPAGVTRARLLCERCPEGEEQRAGLLMTRAAWQTKTLFLSDDKNPDRYELSFPKEFGYVKSLQHYRPESRKSAKYPWSKKY